jgi:hypothetical protein
MSAPGPWELVIGRAAGELAGVTPTADEASLLPEGGGVAA